MFRVPRGHQIPRWRRFSIRKIFEFRFVRQAIEMEKNASAFLEDPAGLLILQV
jgi:hypothetical protein